MKAVRKSKILDKLEKVEAVSVADLARELGVSEMTIRRDLNDLDQEGLLRRVHGGAVTRPSHMGTIEPPMQERMRENAAEKRRIAELMVNMIQLGETIFIGSGTTALAVAEALRPRRDITVVTNALTVVNALHTSHGVSVLVVGGFLRREESSLVGHFSEQALAEIRVDKVIMGIAGIHPKEGLTGDNLQELMTDRAILQMSEAVYVVADHSKFGQVASSVLAPVEQIRAIVTSRLAPADVVADLRSLGVDVIEG